jgi:Uma2 family endonuclease
MGVIEAPMTVAEAERLFQQLTGSLPFRYAQQGRITDMPPRSGYHSQIFDVTTPGQSYMVKQMPRSVGHSGI